MRHPDRVEANVGDGGHREEREGRNRAGAAGSFFVAGRRCGPLCVVGELEGQPAALSVASEYRIEK